MTMPREEAIGRVNVDEYMRANELIVTDEEILSLAGIHDATNDPDCSSFDELYDTRARNAAEFRASALADELVAKLA